jgi:hypothetical protein
MKERPNMAVPFFQRLIANLCPHRFSWPHSGPHGQDYQVCLICGTAYEFDVVEMRRTGRVFHPPEAETGQRFGNDSR